jgi:hypothetical protein
MGKSVSELFSQTWKDIKVNFSFFLKIFILFALIPGLILFAFTQLTIFEIGNQFDNLVDFESMNPADIADFFLQQPILSYILLVVITYIIVLLLNILSDAILVHYAFKNDLEKKKKSDYEGKKYFWKLFGVYFVQFLVIAAIMVVFALIAVLGAYLIKPQTDSTGAIIGFIALVFSLVIIMIIVLTYIGVKWIFSRYILIKENTGVIESLRRSWALVKGKFWLTFGLLLLYLLIIMAVSFAMSMISAVIVLPIQFSYGIDAIGSQTTEIPFTANLIIAFVNKIFQFVQTFVALIFSVLLIKNLYLSYIEDIQKKIKK